MESLNAIDVFLAVVILWSTWSGWRRGFLVGAVQLLTLAAGLLAAFWAYRWPAAWVAAQWPTWSVWAPPLSFLLIYFLVEILTGGIARRLVLALPRAAHANVGNRALGILPGFGNGLIHATVLTVLLLGLPMFDRLTTLTRDSVVAERLSGPVGWIEARLLPIFEPAVRRTLQGLTVPAGSRTSVQLPFEVQQAQARPELESRMLAMVNEERSAHGLQPLRADPELAEVARAHSRDMFRRGYFSHYTPEGGDLGDRLRAAQVRYLLAGENLALARNLRTAHQGLMDSPGHRANILRPQYGRLGIGVLDGGRHGLMVTQNFRN